MYSFVFGLFSLALLFFFGMVHTFFFVKKIQHPLYKRKYRHYGLALGLLGTISFVLACIVYFFGIG